MEYTKYLIITSIWLTCKTAVEACQLDLNEHNKYPYVVRIIYEGETRAHGSLIAPFRVLSAYNALANGSTWQDYGLKLDFIVYVYGKGEALYCSITRKFNRVSTPATDFNNNMALIALNKGVPTSLNRPFLFNRLRDVNQAVIQKVLKRLSDKEPCVLPLFNSQNPEDTKLNVERLSFLKGDAANHSRWKELACKVDNSCKKPYMFAVSPANRLSNLHWYKGAVILCRGMPLGVFSKVVVDQESGLSIAAFEEIATVTIYFYPWCKKEWPKPPPTATTTPKRPTKLVNHESTFMSPIPDGTGSNVSNAHPDRYESSTTTASTFPTIATSHIPLAPEKIFGRTTPQTTPMFIRTRPKRVREANVNKNDNSRTTSTVRATILYNTACLILKYILF